MINSTILVTGAGGTVGRHVASELASQRPRLAFHTAAKAARARAEGHDAVAIDYAVPATLGPALAGIDAVFLLGTGIAGQEQGERAVLAAARGAGVRKIVKLSAWGAPAEAHVIARVHRAVERAIEDSGIAYTFLRANGFMQNFAGHLVATIRAQGAIYLPAADAKISHIDVRDIARVAAQALTSPRHDNRAYELSGPASLGYAEAAEILSRVLGTPIRYVPVTDEAAKAAMVGAHLPEHYADALVELYRAYRVGAGAAVSPAVHEVLGRPPIDFETFVRDHLDAFR